jgi:hypothetical protein
MENKQYEHEGTLKEKIEWIDHKMDQVYSEVKYLERIQTPRVNYLAVITVSILSSALISWLFYMLSK